MRRRRSPVPLVAAVVAASLGLTGRPAPAQDVDHCRLLTAAEVAALMGKPVKSGENTPLECAWIPEGKQMSYFTVLVMAAEKRPRNHFDAGRTDIRIVELKGLRNEAAMAVRRESGNVLDVVVRKGKRHVRFNLPFLEITADSPRFAELRGVIQKAVGRL